MGQPSKALADCLVWCPAAAAAAALQVLCSVTDQRAALAEVLRVLRPGGAAGADLCLISACVTCCSSIS
jgi:ubiquinone/menaquinone biosynthesis C-methylase UbiE